MLRSLGSKSLAFGIAAIAASGAWGGSGCAITKPTELVPGALSQIEVPHDLAGLRLEILSNGNPVFLGRYTVTQGTAFLPATLGVIPNGSGSTTVTIILAGYSQKAVDNPMGEFGDNTRDISEVGTTPDSSPSVRRGSVQTYVSQHTLFLPMPLSYACWGTTCSNSGTAGDTCKANTCTSSNTNSADLVDFDPSLVDGTQECFSPSACFSPVTTAVLVDADKCIYKVPPGQVTGLGLNVRILYQDLKLVKNPATGTNVPETVPTSEQEILNEESPGSLLEGFSIPDPATPDTFQLAPGLCSLVKAVDNPPATTGASGIYHTISAVQVSTTCPSKLPLLPICAAEQNVPAVGVDGGPTTNLVCDQPITLDPVPSAVYMVMDNSSIMSGAFGPQGYATAMGLSLGNPVFKRTYVAFDFLDHLASECSVGAPPGNPTTYTSLAPFGKTGATSMDFTLANVGQPTVAGFLGNVTPPDPAPDGGVPAGGFAPLYLQPAMRLDQGVYKHVLDFTNGLQEAPAIATAMFFINRQPDSTGTGDAGALIPTGVDCDPALDMAGDTSAQQALVEQIVAADKAGVQSYFVILNNALFQVGTPLQYFQTIQSLVKAKGVTTMQVLDATQPKADIGNVLGTFSNVVTPLGTCLYELPPGVGSSTKVNFTIPIPTQLNMQAPAPVPVSYNANCNAANQATQSGWNIEGPPGSLQHLRICGTNAGGSCWQLRASVLAVSAATLTGGGDGGVSDAGAASIPEVPVTVNVPCVDAGQ
jgi:hypothetical protein